MDWEIVYKDLRKLNWIVLLILSSFSHLMMSPSLTIGVILGGFIIIANFRIFQHTIRRAFSSEGVMTVSKMMVILKYYFRLLGLGVILYVLITKGWVDPIGLVIGLSTVVISIVSFGINRTLRIYIREAT